jgi:signal transduction histidine kinase
LLLEETDRARRHEETSARLVEAMGAKDRLLAVLSHELRTPLTPILTWVQSLKREPDARQVRQAADVIERSVHLEARLVEDLLDLGRITGGQVAYEFRTHDLRAILRTAQEALTAPAAGKAIRLESPEGSDPVPVEADADRLLQVFSNLLGNAVKFTPERGAVEVRLLREAEWAVVRIRDTGIGIAPDFMPHVFDMFRQRPDLHRRRCPPAGPASCARIWSPPVISSQCP